MYNRLNRISLIYCFLLWVGLVDLCHSQTITISAPTISFTQACASATFNTYNFSFSFFPIQNLGASNEFFVELSDNAGSFANPTIVKTLTNTTSPVASNFSLPQSTYGEGYKIRIRSTNPVKISPASNAFSAYYAVHNQPFSINGNIGTVNLCGNQDFILRIDNNGTAASPLFYPGLRYKWYKNFIEISGETGPTLVVNQVGSYYVIVDYGTCVMNSYSNIVQFLVQEGLNPTIISENNSTVICPNTSTTLTSVLQNTNYTYAWHKNNIELENSNSPTYEASQEGIYHVTISTGGCEFESNAISLELIDFNLSLDITSEETIIPGETIILSAITDAENPQFQWYRNNNIINGATQVTYNATQNGVYKVTVTQINPCNIVKESTATLAYPNDFTLAVQPTSGYETCTSTSTVLSISQFNAITANGNIDLIGNTYNYNYQWYKNNLPIANATTPTLSLTDALQNGNYTLKITIPNYGIITSNTFTVNLALENVIISSSGILCQNSTVLLSSNISNVGYQYQWYKNGDAILNATSSTYMASLEGDYYVIARNGQCEKQSNTIALGIASIAVTSTNPDFDIILPGEQKIISVSTNAVQPQFAWYRNGLPISGQNQNSISVSQNGQYKVIITQTQGCTATAEKIFTLNYPTQFDITIGVNSDYEQCTSHSITLDITDFTATTPSGIITLTENQTQNYGYQWLKNNIAIQNATSPTLAIMSETENGSYTLLVTLPDFAPIISNAINVNLIDSEPLIISANGQLCIENPQVILSSNYINNSYLYNWFRNDIQVGSGNSPIFSINQAGSYYLKVTNGSCIFTSNTVIILEDDFTLTANNLLTDIIIPGETKALSVTTDAVSPTFKWYRNSILIAETASIAATLDGEYKVVVTQTQGCEMAKEIIFTLSYPSRIEIEIATNSGFQECVNLNASLVISVFNAISSGGTINLLNNTNNYNYQWYKNDIAVFGANSLFLALDNYEASGVYQLRVSIPNFETVISNFITINIGFASEITIATEDIFCSEGTSITIASNITGADFSYKWYKTGNPEIIGEENSITVNRSGNYFLTVSHQNCILTSNIVEIVPFDMSSVAINVGHEVSLMEGNSIIVTATGAENYIWHLNGIQISTGTSLEVSEAGIYTVKAFVGNCETTREFIVMLTENNTMAIPNVVTPNLDGKNDTWTLPSKYVNNSNVEIIIYGPDGAIVLKTTSYSNNWPESNFNYSLKNPVYYYTIMEDGKITKRGSITIVK